MNDEENDVKADEVVGLEDIPKIEDIEEEGDISSITYPPKPPPRRSRSTKKKSSGVSAKKREVKPVDEAKAEPAEVAPLASMSVAGDRIKVQSLWPARLVVRGTPSGEEYVWPKAGAIEAVNPADVDFLMSKNRGKVPSDGRGCCGGEGTRIYLALV